MFRTLGTVKTATNKKEFSHTYTRTHTHTKKKTHPQYSGMLPRDCLPSTRRCWCFFSHFRATAFTNHVLDGQTLTNIFCHCRRPQQWSLLQLLLLFCVCVGGTRGSTVNQKVQGYWRWIAFVTPKNRTQWAKYFDNSSGKLKDGLKTFTLQRGVTGGERGSGDFKERQQK